MSKVAKKSEAKAPPKVLKGKQAQKQKAAKPRAGDRAKQVAKAIVKPRQAQLKKIRTSVHFHRPKTLALARKPKYQRCSVVSSRPKLDKYRIVRHPLTTEKAMKKIEENNTLTFIVDVQANKSQIKQAVKALYEVDCQRVNTLIRPDGKKKAFVRLTGDSDALDVANRIGII